MNDSEIMKKVEKLISKGKELSNELYSHRHYHWSSYNEIIDKHLIDLTKWKEDCLNLLKLRFGGSSYSNNFKERLCIEYQNSGEFYKENVSEAVAVLMSLKEAFEEGLTEDLYYQKEILLFGDLLKQAEEFFDKKFDLVATIYGRIILETTIKEFAVKNNIDENDFEQNIIALRKAGLITQTFEHSLRSKYALGSAATHNKQEFDKISRGEIKEFLSFIRDRVLTL